MVNVLPEVPGFGSSMGAALGGGIQKGASRATDFAMQMAMEKQKQALRMQNIEKAKQMTGRGQGQQPQQSLEQQFMQILPIAEQYKGSELTTQETDEIWQGLQQMSYEQRGMLLQGKQQPMGQQGSQQEEDPYAYADMLSALGERDMAHNEMKKAEIGSRERMGHEKLAEPKLQELNDKLRTQKASGMRFKRLEQLSSPELENQFPPGFLVGMLSKDGELRPTFASQISPDAQEFVKLISDEMTGAKDTFGARVTNFDLQSYMKRLPSLINSAEGRRRVLRDLQIMNELNVSHDQGVLDIIDRYGGPGKISISKAERIFDKENASKIEQLTQEFINPEKTEFQDLPDAARYRGREVIDPETKQKFRSDGSQWVPI
jgi:hypothetical protein